MAVISRNLETRATINDVWIERIGRDVRIFVGSDGMPVMEGDLAIVATAQRAGRAALLLATVHPVWVLIVGDDVVELRRGLVVPGAPSASTVYADGCALIDSHENDVRIFWVDPD